MSAGIGRDGAGAWGAALKTTAGALVLTAVAVVLPLVLAGSDLDGVYGAVAAGWLGLHQVPLLIDHARLGLLPLLPTALLVRAATRSVARTTGPDQTVRELGAAVFAAVSV